MLPPAAWHQCCQDGRPSVAQYQSKTMCRTRADPHTRSAPAAGWPPGQSCHPPAPRPDAPGRAPCHSESPARHRAIDPGALRWRECASRYRGAVHGSRPAAATASGWQRLGAGERDAGRRRLLAQHLKGVTEGIEAALQHRIQVFRRRRRHHLADAPPDTGPRSGLR